MYGLGVCRCMKFTNILAVSVHVHVDTHPTCKKKYTVIGDK